ncbi:molybdopterin cofactor-binding domain-containing protein [Parvibaculum sp.]|uniref:xanthine dehydrogenase family protein molybdopterin-binding subunit n=1 Tax=Parvibaculum sp. TaxID=2024848 RepID=UPI001B150CDE|nr:molybdopterin cofactor-binding domain-containing protein [Parvibaculum sp.]MBO6668165.1 xanthine dehydrogenase family protein molybdopterin-binding subunit [Parvibaculum sp.]MBO6691699.1 xanthine dehydrogenase family protein molybdopterin-binding subunit [Parvibaculum sp.]MBO6714717.1 xanthine dehydrogenase family protein molybdopterin-binding subunit [Parvibaculum sp.]
MKLGKPTRRQFLIAGGAVAGGALLIGYASSGPSRRAQADAAASAGGERFVTTWLKIAPDNTVTVYVPHADMGQGTITALAMMAAEELDADWSLVRAEQAPAESAFANESLGNRFVPGDGVPPMLKGVNAAAWYQVAKFMSLQITGGSMAVRYTGQHGMRTTGAAAKEMLLKAAASRWNCSPSDCTAAMSMVTGPKGETATYGELAADAAEYSPSASPKLKSRSEYKIVGTPRPRFDIPGKVDGSAKYGIDARPEGLLYAAVRLGPVSRSTVVSYDASQVLSRRGVKKVVEFPGGVAVVADNYWRAKEAAAALDVEFDAGDKVNVSSETIFAAQAEALSRETDEDKEVGDAASVFSSAPETEGAEIVSAEYRVPYLAHACMEPMNCTVWIRDGKADVWVGVQDPLGTRARIADVTGIDFDNVTVHPMLLGGGFGRRIPLREGFFDFPSEIDFAAIIAKEVDAPVKLVYSREDDIQHDAYRPAVTSRIRAVVGPDGYPTAYENLYVYKDDPEEAPHITYGIANQSIRYAEVPTHIPRGPWRSVAHTQHTFFSESFFDELAHRAGKDPLEYRLALLKDQPRHAAVLKLAAEKAGWGKKLPEGHYHGLAVQQSFGSIVAEVAEVSIVDGSPRIHRVVAAVDCGLVVHPDTAAQQVESGIIYGLTAALYGEISIENGAVVQTNFTDYEMLHLSECPEIEVHFVDSDAPIGGLGEPATPVVSAAVSNAIFAATGTRIRQLPFKLHDLSQVSDKFAQAAD